MSRRKTHRSGQSPSGIRRSSACGPTATTSPMASRTKIASAGHATESPGAMAYLVDTNIVVDVTRGSITAADYLDSLAGAWSISTITGSIAVSFKRAGLTPDPRTGLHSTKQTNRAPGLGAQLMQDS